MTGYISMNVNADQWGIHASKTKGFVMLADPDKNTIHVVLCFWSSPRTHEDTWPTAMHSNDVKYSTSTFHMYKAMN